MHADDRPRIVISDPLMTSAIRDDGREHPLAWVPVDCTQHTQTGRPSDQERKKLLRASFGLNFIALTEVLVQRAIRVGSANGRPRDVLRDDVEQAILSEVAAPWSAATVKDAAKKSVDELCPCPTLAQYKDFARDIGRSDAVMSDGREAVEIWIAEQTRILRLLGIAGFQDQFISGEQVKLGNALRRHDDEWFAGKEAMMEERLLIDARQQEKFCLTLPEMVEVAIHGHIDPAELWRDYYLSSPMFDAARCAGWCGIGKVGALSERGRTWLYNYLAKRSCLDDCHDDDEAQSRYFRCRDLIIQAFNGLAQVKLDFLHKHLLAEVKSLICEGGPIAIKTPTTFVRQRMA